MHNVTLETTGGRRARRLPSRRKLGRSALLAGTLLVSNLAGSLAAPSPISAALAVNEPPVAGHQIISFPARDFVSASGYTPGASYTVQVLRNGVVIGTSDPVTADATGLVEVNHPGGGCWANITPDISPGDQVRVINAAGTVADQTTTANVTAGLPVQVGAAVADAKGVLRYTIAVHGTAQDALGAPLPADQVEQRLVANKNAFDLNGRRTLRAGGAGKDGTFAYDPISAANPAGIKWTATYSGLDQRDRDMALDNTVTQSRALWLGRDPLAGTELTIFEKNLVTPGPQAPCTAPLGASPAPPPGADTVAPSVPTGVDASVSGGNNVTVTWTGSTDNVGVVGYDIYRNAVAVGKVGFPEASFVDGGVPDGTYTYTVDAFDAAGNHSAKSVPSSSVATLAPPPPPAGVNAPPPAGRQIISFPARDFVSATGYPVANGPYRVQVWRLGKLIGTSDPVTPQDDPKTTGFDGLIEVNHPGGGCWVGVTPNISPGDQIRVVSADGTTIIDQTTTANVTSEFPIEAGAGILKVHGTAQDAFGNPLPVAQVEARLVANKNAFDKNGRRTLRAGGAGKDGTFAYDGPGLVTWTATFTGLDAHDMSLALDPNADQSRALWLGANPLAGTELTIFEANQVTPGPQAPCTAPLAP